MSIADARFTAVPDPYFIDDDDMVIVNGLEDPVINAPIPKRDKSSKSKGKREEDTSPLKNNLPDRTRSKRDSKRQPNLPRDDDDVVMIDAPHTDGLDVADGPDELAFVTKPKGLQRSNTTSKKPETKMSGLFGAFRKSRRASETFERSKAIIEDDATPRKRTAATADDSAKRARRDDRRKSTKPDRAAEGYVYNTEPADVGATTEAEDAEARREERRAKRAEEKQAVKLAREAELQAIEDRRAKRRKAERDAEAKKQEERDARHAARRAKEENQDNQRSREEEAAANKDLADEVLLKPRTKRRETSESHPSRSKHRSTTERRKSYLDPTPQETPAESSSRRPKSSRRKSTAPPAGESPVDDYFDARNANTKSSKNQDNDPYGGNDHTSSWVKSQISDPPAPPPVEPTILETDPVLGGAGDKAGGGPADDLMADEEVRRKNRKKRRSKAYVDQIAEDQEERAQRRSARRAGDSDGSADAPGGVYVAGRERRKSDALGGVKLGAGEKTWDAKTGQGKRSSWFQSFRR